jgi:hypothetical protein
MLRNILTMLAVCLFDAQGVVFLDATCIETRVGRGSDPNRDGLERRHCLEGGVPT